MVNTEEFSKRLKLILDYYDITASALADSIDIQRSSISHILSGRNKPSLDFVLKLLKTYPEVELNWLMNGKGKFPKNDTYPPLETNLFSEIEENNTSKFDASLKKEYQSTKVIDDLLSNNSNEIDQIVIFYKSGKFRIYKP
jgi:transcriptional regulator with XRE-family HTH domain